MIYFDLEPGLTEQTIHEALEGVTVTLKIRWNERFGYWTMNIYDRQQESIINGIKLSRGVLLLDPYNIDALAGDFAFVRTSGEKEEADFSSIGGDFSLVYLTGDEVNVIQSQN